MSKDRNSIDSLMESQDLNQDGLFKENKKNSHIFNEALTVTDDVDVFDEDDESIKKRKRRAQAEILLEKKRIRQQYRNSGQYLNKE